MVPYTMCPLEEVSAHMCAENYELCSYDITIPSTCDPCGHVKISKPVETGANARSDQLMGQDEADHVMGHSPPGGADVVTETTLDDEFVEVTASELILLTRPALARSESAHMTVEFLARISACREAGHPVATDTDTCPPCGENSDTAADFVYMSREPTGKGREEMADVIKRPPEAGRVTLKRQRAPCEARGKNPQSSSSSHSSRARTSRSFSWARAPSGWP